MIVFTRKPEQCQCGKHNGNVYSERAYWNISWPKELLERNRTCYQTGYHLQPVVVGGPYTTLQEVSSY